MRAMILAAGRGERMRPLTDNCPKPLLEVGGRSLIVWHLEALAQAGIRQVVINHAHLGVMIEQALGDGRRWGLQIHYSAERQALETAGGIRRALHHLGNDPFLVVNGDIHTDFDFGRARSISQQMLAAELDCWCVMVPNPDHHPQGDFGLESGRLLNRTIAPERPRLTFSGVGIYCPGLFERLPDGEPARLAPLLERSAAAGRAGGELHTGHWTDVGTPLRLATLNEQFAHRPH